MRGGGKHRNLRLVFPLLLDIVGNLGIKRLEISAIKQQVAVCDQHNETKDYASGPNEKFNQIDFAIPVDHGINNRIISIKLNIVKNKSLTTFEVIRIKF